MKVIEHKDMNYIVRNIVSNKTKNIFGGLLRPFVFNPAVSQPMDTARRDYMKFYIEAIKEHKRDIKKLSSLTFLVKWLNFEDFFNTWEPWSGLRLTDQLHSYLISKNLRSLIPTKLRNPD